jgi:SAM-dependent methyltransferase
MNPMPQIATANTERSNSRCDICESEEKEVIAELDRDRRPLRTVICKCCGLVYSDPRPDSSQLREYYENAYRVDYKETVEPRPKHVYRAGKVALERLSRIQPVIQEGSRILDFGAGSGEVVFMLRSLGFDASGFEPNSGYACFASKRLGLPVTHGFYQDARIEPGSLDVVTAFHVFEHLESPLHAFAHVRGWLRTGGYLLVEVPNIESRCQWPGSRFHRAHLFNFNPATLEMAGRKNGYSVVSTSVSEDGGNVTVIFQKQDIPLSDEWLAKGNYERVLAIVRGHTPLKHAFSRHPYQRIIRKVLCRVEERKAVGQCTCAETILSGLVKAKLAGPQSETPSTFRLMAS